MELFIVAGFLAVLVSTTSAYDFYVGGRDGWVEKPSESYSQWTARMRFQAHDKLVFKYKKGEDSVLVVKKEDYDSCNTSNPVKKMDDGDSTFRFGHSGPFYFISGADGKCAKGQKMIVVVLAERTKAKAPSPSTEPPASSPLPPSESPSASPASPPLPPSESPSASPASPFLPPSESPSASPSSPPSSALVSPAVSPVQSPSDSDSSEFSPAPSPVQQSSAFAMTVSSVTVLVVVLATVMV